MHFHLDPVGGLAGDMFAAALIDLRPELAVGLQREFEAAGLSSQVQVSARPHSDHVLAGHRFEVQVLDAEVQSTHRTHRDIRAFLAGTSLASPVRERCAAIFDLLARAEGRVHGIAPDEVSFHEVGEWDSVADIVAAAWLIERFAGATWSCGALPLGNGYVTSQHGRLPLPAPATAVLLEGFPVLQDDIPGERVTPTGAAILRHLNPDFAPLGGTMSLAGSGIGHGSRELAGISNILRVLAFETAEHASSSEQLTVCQFEVDDQTPEDLAVALENLRSAPGVVDVIQSTVTGKKGRLANQIQVLAQPDALAETLNRCFLETTTLGIRFHRVARVILDRTEGGFDVRGRRVRVKRARRPSATITEKAEMDDLADEPGGFRARERLRRESERMAAAGKGDGKNDLGADFD